MGPQWLNQVESESESESKTKTKIDGVDVFLLAQYAHCLQSHQAVFFLFYTISLLSITIYKQSFFTRGQKVDPLSMVEVVAM